MCQNIRSKTYSNILFIIFLFSLIPTTNATFTADDCKKMREKSQCKCEVLLATVQNIKCPDSQIEVQITRLNYYMEVNIISNSSLDNAYELLPEMAIGDVNYLTLSYFPLPSQPISKLFNHLGITKLENLNITYSGNLKHNINREHLNGFTNLETLTLYDQDISLVPNNLFFQVRKLTRLSFEIGNIQNVSSIFAYLRNLKYLSLSSKNLEQIPANIFHNQRNLEFLKIAFNQLSNISRDLFLGPTSLRVLDLSRNKIQSLQSDVFSGLTDLGEIYLSNNEIQELPSGLFSCNRNLEQVYIRNNRVPFKALPPALFANVRNLKRVDITCGKTVFEDIFKILFFGGAIRISCGLDFIPADLFTNSSKFFKIFLDQNELLSVDANLFAEQRDLQRLNMSHNRLETLPDELFLNTTKLINLDLSYNHLTEISNKIFKSLYSLIELHLGSNRLVTISPDAFVNTKDLYYIYMENNYIKLSDPASNQNESNTLNELTPPFQFLKELKILNLSNNTLSYIFSDWKYKMKKLKVLDLSYNNITSLSCSDLLFHSSTDLFRSKKNLSINLSYNHISKLSFRNNTIFAGSPNRLTNVQLNNNPLNCDCNLLQFVQYVRGKAPTGKLNLIIYDLACDKPENMMGLNASNVGPKDLLCPLELPDCPKNCGCWERTHDLVLVVNCSKKFLKEVPALPHVPFPLKKFELHIDNNELYELPIVSQTGYADVTEIYASGNKLSQIGLQNFPRNMTYIDLSRNKFNELSTEVLNFFNQSNSHRKIALSENPWNCECKNRELLVFVTKSNATITDLDNVRCATPTNDKMADYFFDNKICNNKQFVIIALSVVGFSITLIAALYYKYQTEVKVWMYKYRICSCLVNEEELDKDKKYDAFISYSHKDELFIAERLVSELEEGPMRFKLCIYVRDFIVGEYIPDQIINAINNSRRTIIVLSENFINSVWARMEFRLAHMAALNEGRARIIVIIYGKIGDVHKLDMDLQAYLKMNIYLEWGDPWFWEKLRYAMPHQSRKQHSVVQRNDDDNMEINEIPMVQILRDAESNNEVS